MRTVAESSRIRRALNLRPGEGRVFGVMAGFLFLNTANTTVLSAAKNGLFLSVYEPELIPHAVIAAALVTAAVAVIFTGVVAGTGRRTLATGLTAVLVATVAGAVALFNLNARSAFAVYLLLSAVQVLVLTHAWDYASSMLTGRQAKRLLPLIGVGASLGAIAGGTGVAPAAIRMGTVNLLWISVALLLAGLPLLWLVTTPAREIDDSEGNPILVFIARSGRGFQAVANNGLLRLLALGLVALTMTGTLIDLQLKFVLQETFARDDITAIYGLMSAAVGTGTLLLQLWASRVLFPRFGVSFAAILHGGALVMAAGGAAVFGGLVMLVVAQAIDDILQFSLQKPVEQVSLLPFPGRVKSVALATLGGVLRPLSKAAGGGVALGLAGQPELLPVATVASASVAVATYTRHRGRYMSALESALARHVVDFTESKNTPLVVDKSTLSIIDRGLDDEDATVVIFSVSLLEQLPAEDALPRLTQLIGHPVPEVRAEAAGVLGRIDAPLDFATGMSIASRLTQEDVPYVLARLLESIGRSGGVEPAAILDFIDHEEIDVRCAALVALSRLGWQAAEERVRDLLRSPDPGDRNVAARCVGELGLVELMDQMVDLIEDPETRAAALEELARLGADAVPHLAGVLHRRELQLALRRTVISALATIEDGAAVSVLVGLLEEPVLGPAALHSLSRMRANDGLPAIEEEQLRDVVSIEMVKAVRLTQGSVQVREAATSTMDVFLANELEGLYGRSVQRVLKLLALSYDPERIERISTALLSDNPARRSNALELLEGTVSGPSTTLVMPFMDSVADGMPAERMAALLDSDPSTEATPIDQLLLEPDWWTQALAMHYLGRGDEVFMPGHRPDPTEDTEMIPLVEKVMILKGSEFFRNFPGSELAGIAALSKVVHVDDGDVIFEQGEEGDAFYMVVRGAVVISRGATKLATLGPREGFGEMAILDKESRSATATASEPSTLLSLDRDSFDRVIEQNPVVARGVYRVLTERLRNTLAQVAAG